MPESARQAHPKAVLELLCGYQSRDPIRRYLHGQRRRLIARMIRKYGKAGGHALDVGSGIGTYVPHLLHRFETVTCIDHCAHLLAYVRERFPVEDRLRLVRADAHRLPFPDGGFDFVLCSELLEHVRHPVEVLRELARMKRRAAPLVLSTPQRFSLPELTADLFFSRPFRGLVTAILKEPVYDCGHVGRLTSKAFKSLVASAGLTIEESCFFGAFLPVVTQPWGRNWIGVLRRLDRYWQRWPWRSLLWTQLYVVR